MWPSLAGLCEYDEVADGLLPALTSRSVNSTSDSSVNLSLSVRGFADAGARGSGVGEHDQKQLSPASPQQGLGLAAVNTPSADTREWLCLIPEPRALYPLYYFCAFSCDFSVLMHGVKRRRLLSITHVHVCAMQLPTPLTFNRMGTGATKTRQRHISLIATSYRP